MRPGSLVTKFSVISCLVLLSFAAFLQVSSEFTHHMQDEARRINLAGSERMRLYKIANIMHEVLNSDAFDIEESRQDIADFERIIYAVRDGSEELGLSPLPPGRGHGEVQRAADAIIARWTAVRPSLDDVLYAVARGESKSALVSAGRYIESTQAFVADIDRFVNFLEAHYSHEHSNQRDKTRMVFAVALLFFIAGLLYIKKTVVQPLTSLSHSVTEFGRGNLTAHADESHPGEIGDLAKAFNHMAGALRHRIGIEELISGLSSGFINIPSEEIEGEIEGSLRKIGEFCGVDHAYIHLLSKDGTILELASEWHNADARPDSTAYQRLPVEAIPWSFEKLKKGEVFSVGNVSSLPSEADGERKFITAARGRSILAVPLLYRNSLIGALGMASLRREVAWSEEDTKVLKLAGEIFTNALARKSTEEALKKYSEMLEEIVGDRTRNLESANTELRKLLNAIEHSADAVVITDTLGRIQYVNPAFTHMTGYTKEEAAGRNPNILNSGKNPAGLFTGMWKTIRAGRVWEGTVINRKKDGSLYYEEMTVAPVLNERRETVSYIAVKTDVTERMRIEKDLENKSHELEVFGNHLRKIYEVSFSVRESAYDFANMILSEVAETLDVDVAGIGSMVNNEWTSYAVADRKGLGLTAERHCSECEALCDVVYRTGKPLVITDVSGVPAYRGYPDFRQGGIVSFLGVPVFIQEDFFGVLFTASRTPHAYTEHDVILHQLLGKRMEFEFIREKYDDELRSATIQAETANRAKSEFLANMSHELRTPLNSIIGFSRLIHEGTAGPLTPEQKDFMNDVIESGNHLLALISDILDLSKVEAGKMDLVLTTFDLRDLLERSLSMFREKAVKHRITAEISVASDVGAVTADEVRIKQIVFNLLSNAFKFTQDGGSVRLSARLVTRDEWLVTSKKLPPTPYPLPPDGTFIEISVSDTGIGISEENQARLFRPFEQLETSYTKKYGGTGLGLQLSKRFVELHGGYIWVESEPGRGSTFFFTIPVRRGERRL